MNHPTIDRASVKLIRAASLSLCLALSVPLPSAALTPAPPARVADGDAIRLLEKEYPGERVALGASWPVARGASAADGARAPDHREICADSGGGRPGPRYIAVCAALADAGHAEPGLVDLWIILDARGKDGRPRIGARLRELTTGSWGTPGAVALVEVGPRRHAFALSSGYSNMGWSTNQVTLYHAEHDRFEALLTVATHLSNGGACDPAEDRGCRAGSVALDCTLRVDTARYQAGFYDLAVDVSGSRGGRKVARSIAIPRVDGAYRVPADALKRDGCDEGF